MIELNKLFFDNCFNIFPLINDASIDLILTDLPYQITKNKWDIKLPMNDYIEYNNKQLSKETYFLNEFKNNKKYDEVLNYWLLNHKKGLWYFFWKSLKENGVIALTASEPFRSYLVSSCEEYFKHEWIWIKNRGSNFANTVREPFKEHESILIFSKGKWTYNKQMQERTGGGLSRVKYDFNHITESTNYQKFNRPSDSKNKKLRVPSSWQKFNTEVGLHPNQKPVPLMEYIIKTYTNEQEIVLDCCAGSGSTLIACLNTNRNFIGIENNKKYYDKANNRLYEKRNNN